MKEADEKKIDGSKTRKNAKRYERMMEDTEKEENVDRIFFKTALKNIERNRTNRRDVTDPNKI